MKKILITKIKNELKAINADPAISEFILNNCSMYNDLIERYNLPNSEVKIMYLIYQINGQIVKQMNAIKLMNKKLGKEIQEDGFTKMMKELKESANN